MRPLGWLGLKLTGIVTDDGLPAGSTLTSNWTKTLGDGSVIFEDATQPVTTVVLNGSGGGIFPNTIRFTLSASDSALTGSAEGNLRVFASNQPPVPNAGPNQAITLRRLRA